MLSDSVSEPAIDLDAGLELSSSPSSGARYNKSTHFHFISCLFFFFPFVFISSHKQLCTPTKREKGGSRRGGARWNSKENAEADEQLEDASEHEKVEWKQHYDGFQCQHYVWHLGRRHSQGRRRRRCFFKNFILFFFIFFLFLFFFRSDSTAFASYEATASHSRQLY